MANLNYDFSEVDDAQLEGSSWVDRPGDYKVTITGVDDTFTKVENAVVVDMQIVDGDPKDQVGRLMRERLYTSPKAMPRILQFAVAAGLGSREQLKRQQVALDLTQAVGRQIIVKVIAETYTTDSGEEKQRHKVGYLDFFAAKPAPPTAAASTVSPAAPPTVGGNSKSPYADL